MENSLVLITSSKSRNCKENIYVLNNIANLKKTYPVKKSAITLFGQGCVGISSIDFSMELENSLPFLVVFQYFIDFKLICMI